MSFKVVVEKEAEEDMKAAVHWIAQYSIEDETVYALRVRHQAQEVISPDDEG